MHHGRAAIKSLAMSLAMLLAVNNACAEEARIVQLKHRSAEELIPLIRPLLGPEDALSGTDYRLVIRTSDRNMKEIERILAQVDVARQQLRITVEQATADERERQSQSVSGEVRIGDHARISRPGKSPDEGGLVVQKDGLRYNAVRRTTTTRNTNTQTLMAQDGQRAFIRIGQSVPHVRKILAFGRHHPVLVNDIEWQDVTTGFEVLPRVRGDRVLLEITPRLASRQSPGTEIVNYQELSTVVETKRGEWLDLGQILGSRGEIERAILDSAATSSGERRTVRIKVD